MILIDKERFIEEVRKRKYSSASIKLIEEQPTVEAIPIEWIKKFIDNVDGNFLYPEIIEFALQDMIDEWEKENDKQ